ncbi:MAG: MBL fold metallo-hydrolase [Christensenellales bacterium]|jgi:phosphoribosyl 1,2-cyclic phosphodiesterase
MDDCMLVPLFSGSKGNATLLSLRGTRLLIDAGVSCRSLVARLAEANVAPETLSAVLVTHEHTDHIKGVGTFSRRYDLPVFATEGTWNAMRDYLGDIAPENVRVIRAGEDFYIDRVGVLPFEIPHDAAEPVGYALASGGAKLCVATDLGCVRDSWVRQIEGADAVLLEANHDVEMLKCGRYPFALKRRILGRHGHLSNVDAGSVAARLAENGVRRIILGHLSEENNFPELAFRTVQDALDDAGAAEAQLSVALWHRGETNHA